MKKVAFGKSIMVVVFSVLILSLGGCNFFTLQEVDNFSATATVESDDPRVVSDGDRGMQILLCLEESGAKMYGSMTCGYCSNQKKSLGAAAEAEFGRVWIECHPQAENTQMWDCLEAKIEVYPTWVFGDGNQVRGFIEPARLQELSGCTDDVLDQY